MFFFARERLYPALSHHHFIFLSIRVRPESFSSFQNKISSFFPVQICRHGAGATQNRNLFNWVGGFRVRECALPYGGVYIQSFDTARNNVANFFYPPSSFLIDFFHEDEPTFFFSTPLMMRQPRWRALPRRLTSSSFFSSGCTFYFIYFILFFLLMEGGGLLHHRSRRTQRDKKKGGAPGGGIAGGVFFLGGGGVGGNGSTSVVVHCRPDSRRGCQSIRKRGTKKGGQAI